MGRYSGLITGKQRRVPGDYAVQPTAAEPKPRKAKTRRYEYHLPYPPSCNRTVMRASGHTFTAPAVKTYRANVEAEVFSQGGPPRIAENVSVYVYAIPPDNGRRHDADNIPKVLFDALSKAGVFVDDCQVKLFQVTMEPPNGAGSVSVRVLVE